MNTKSDDSSRGPLFMLKAFLWSAALASLLIVGATYFFLNPRSEVPRGGDFTLHSASGPVSLRDFRGKGVVLYFGFTSCPDICPMSMSHLEKAISGLPPEKSGNLQVLFVSFDHRGDTPAKAQEYVTFFFKGAVGVTGSKDELDAVARQYGTSYLIEETTKSAMGYTVQHSASYFLIDRKGKFKGTVPGETSVEALREELSQL